MTFFFVESDKDRLGDGESNDDDETDNLGLSWPAARRRDGMFLWFAHIISTHEVSSLN